MTEGFLALAWRGSAAPSERLAALTARADLKFGLRSVFTGAGLQVLAGARTLHRPVAAQGGVVLGPLFHRGAGGGPVRAGEPCLSAALVRSAGDSLLREAWGGYLAFIVDQARPAVHVLRDPSGFLPCYWCETEDLTAFFSDPAVAVGLLLITPRIDTAFVAHHLAYPDLRTTRTGLVGVSDLLAGTRLTLDARGMDVACRWTPWSFTAQSRAADRTSAVGQLREEIERCVAAWASTAPSILLELSGGLDSSIVAVSLARTASALACVTLATPDPAADERRYALAVTQAIGASLQAAVLSLDKAEPRRPPRPLLARPGHGVLQQVVDAAFIDAAADRPLDAYMSGGGGDNVFCYLASAAPAADAWRSAGPGPLFLRAVGDLAALHGCTVWRAARLALRKAWRPAHLTWRRDEQFLAPGAAPANPWPHPWLEAPPGAWPGSIEHVAALMRIQSLSDGKERLSRAPVRYPLLSQPVVEFCLTLPSWMWITGGRDRALARDAFADRLPAEVLHRRSKGDFVPFCGAIYARHRAALKGHLIGGWLDSQGLLDARAIERHLDAPGPPRGEGFYRLLTLAAVEAWARRWTAGGDGDAPGAP
jgi:asparagine synthase (glutamine-hydrolysing)